MKYNTVIILHEKIAFQTVIVFSRKSTLLFWKPCSVNLKLPVYIVKVTILKFNEDRQTLLLKVKLDISENVFLAYYGL